MLYKISHIVLQSSGFRWTKNKVSRTSKSLEIEFFYKEKFFQKKKKTMSLKVFHRFKEETMMREDRNLLKQREENKIQVQYRNQVQQRKEITLQVKYRNQVRSVLVTR